MTARSERQHESGCVVSRSRCQPFIMLQQSAQRPVADDVLQAKVLDRLRSWKFEVDRPIAERLMWTLGMVVAQPFLENVSQMAFAENYEMIETRGFCAAHPGFSKGTHVWRSRRYWPKLNAIGL